MPALIKALILALPEILKILKYTQEKIKDGIQDQVITRSLERSSEAFKMKNRAEAARILSEEHSDN